MPQPIRSSAAECRPRHTVARRCGNIRCVRTTLTIADDVLLAARERARRDGRPLGDVLSELARAGLNSEGAPSWEASDEQGVHGFAPFPRRGPAVSNELIERLLDEDLA